MKKETARNARVNKDLDGLLVDINALGEIKTNIDFDKINAFLNKHVEDKKLKHLNTIEA